MMCYRDMTFCTAACANAGCPIKCTPSVREDARKWWGGKDAPVAVGDRSVGCADWQPDYRTATAERGAG